MPRTTIKGQAIVDFVAEFTYPTKALRVATDTPSMLERRKKNDEPSKLSNVWSLRIDGTGIILESLTGEKISYSLRLEFPVLNNEAEYEALLAGLQLAKEMRVEQLIIYSDSQLVVKQVNRDYQAKGENMVAYLKIAGGN